MSIRAGAACRLAAVVLGLGAISSCATLDKEECASVNWEQLGRSDGAEGRPSSRIDQHRSACAEHKLPVDEQQWASGWQQGIRVYCTPDNGLMQGREGRHYANSCPPELKTDFEAAYFVAKRLYDARQSRDTLQRDIDSLVSSLRRAEKREEKEKVRRQIDEKRSALRIAERRVWDAEADYELYLRQQRLSRR